MVIYREDVEVQNIIKNRKDIKVMNDRSNDFSTNPAAVKRRLRSQLGLYRKSKPIMAR